MRFRKKPVVLEATPIEFIIAVGKETPEVLPDWVQDAITKQMLKLYQEVVVVRTMEGDMRGSVGDWLIQGVRGEIYPCDGSIFEETYESVE